MNRWLLLAVAASVGLAACSKKEEPAPPAEAPQFAAPASAPVASQAATPNSGKVVQLEQGGGYTYAQVETAGGQQVWIAGGHIEVRPGDTVQWGDYAVMTNFNAKSLGRVFDEILFVNAWGPVGGATTGVAPHGVQPGQQPTSHAAVPASASDAAPAAAQSVGVVKSAANAGGYSYLEVEQNGSMVWVAAPETQVKAGDKVSWDSGMVMRDFKSSSLNRTFGEIVFAGGVRVIQ